MEAEEKEESWKRKEEKGRGKRIRGAEREKNKRACENAEKRKREVLAGD